MAEPTLQDTVSGNVANTTTITVTKPSNTVSSNIIYVSLHCRQGGSTYSAPDSTWTEFVAFGANSDVYAYSSCWWKRAGGSEPSTYTFTWGGSSVDDHSWSASRCDDCDPNDPIDTNIGTFGSSSAVGDIDSPSITTTVADTRVVYGVTVRGDTVIGFPSSASEVFDIASQGPDAVWYTKAQASAGSTGVGAWDLNTTAYASAYTFAIRPATGAVGQGNSVVTDSSGSASTTATSNLPVGAVEGDLLSVAVYGTASGLTISADDGNFTERAEFSRSDASRGRIALYTKTVGASEASTHTFTLSSSSKWICIAWINTDVDTSDPVDDIQTGENTSVDTTCTFVAATASGGDRIAVRICGTNNNRTLTVDDGDLTLIGQSNQTSDNGSLHAAYEVVSASGSIGTSANTFNDTCKDSYITIIYNQAVAAARFPHLMMMGIG